MHVVTIMGSLLSIDSQTAEFQTAEFQTAELQTAELHDVQIELELARNKLKKAEEVSNALHEVRIKLRLALEKQKKELYLSDAAFAELAIVRGENKHLRCRLDDLRFIFVGLNKQINNINDNLQGLLPTDHEKIKAVLDEVEIMRQICTIYSNIVQT